MAGLRTQKPLGSAPVLLYIRAGQPPMIDICHVQVLPILSGVQRAMLEIFRHLDRSRYQPHVVCQQPGPLTVELAALDIPCHFAPSLARPIRPGADARAYRELSTLFRRHRFTLVHTHSSKPGVLGANRGPTCRRAVDHPPRPFVRIPRTIIRLESLAL